MRFLWIPSIVLAVGFLPATARADDRAIAQQAFQDGRDLMAAGRFAEACPKFAAAAQLSQTSGVRLNLADCYAKLGKTAMAWAKASEALSLAERGDDWAAAALARDRLAALKPKLSYLTIMVARETAPDDLEVAIDGEKIPGPVWGTPLPVDPGDHEVTATAKGRQPASMTVKIAGPGAPTIVTLPDLAPAGGDERPASIWSRRTARTLALVSGGLGVVGLGIGTAFGVDASAKKSQYTQLLSPTTQQCTSQSCANLTDEAFHSATASTVSFIAGGALLAAGVALWLTAPAAKPEATEVAVVPMVGGEGMGACLSGRF
jgi:hypothetical protein